MDDANDVLAALESATGRLLDGVASLSDAAATQPSLLPGWSRGHVLTHLARNAEGSTRLLTWARTGVPSYEYESAEARAAEIGAGRTLPRAQSLAFALGGPAGTPAPDVAVDQPLSGRELEVVALVAAGLANRAIAEQLFLSPRTVEKHVEHVMDKLGVGSRAEIAAWHARTGLTSG